MKIYTFSEKSTIFNSIAWGRDKYHLICYADSHHSGHLVAFSRAFAVGCSEMIK